MPQTNSRKVNQRRRFEKQRKENRQRLTEIREHEKATTTTS